MKNVTIVISGGQRYWFNNGLVAAISTRFNIAEAKIGVLLRDNDVLRISNIAPTLAKVFLEDLEVAGFEVGLKESGGVINAVIGMPLERELDFLKKDVSAILERIKELEFQNTAPATSGQVRSSDVYKKLEAEGKEETLKETSRTAAIVKEKAAPSATREEIIGKYWLPVVGVCTLLAGVVFLVTYVTRFLGPWGKLGCGFVVGFLLIGAGNYLSAREKYLKWAMSVIGGGWAIVYFTVFAACFLPVVKVIHNPSLGFALLMAAAVCFIIQSLKHKSGVLVFLSYALAYISIVATGATVYTLLASCLLAVSIVVITWRLGWNWLALVGLILVNYIQWVWIAPSIFSETPGSTGVTDIIFLPWTQDKWRAYPLPNVNRSALELSFLTLYWMLFTVVGFFRAAKDKVGKGLVLGILFINSFIFTVCFMYHLHVFYPGKKPIFSLAMCVVFFLLSLLETKLKKDDLSDMYLGFSSALFCLTIPLLTDGASVTYGWAAASAVLIWLGLRHSKLVLRVAGGVVAIFVMLRLLYMDFLSDKVLANIIMPVYASMPVAIAVGVSFYIIHVLYSKYEKPTYEDKNIIAQTALIMAFSAWALAFLMGGFREAASFVMLAEGLILLMAGADKNLKPLRYAGVVFITLSVFRFVIVDFNVELFRLYLSHAVILRYILGLVSVPLLFVCAGRINKKLQTNTREPWLFPLLVWSAALIFVVIACDKCLDSWISIMWGAAALGFIVSGFQGREKIYRWAGLAIFGLLVLRLCFHDFARLQMPLRIISFMGLGIVFILSGFVYNYYSKIFLKREKAALSKSTGS